MSDRMSEADTLVKEKLMALPRHAAPASLKRALRERFAPAPRRDRRAWFFVAIAAIAAAIAFYAGTRVRDRRGDEQALVGEAVGDHLRIVYAEHPLDVASGGMHQVKPWFTGKLDFAPVLAFGGDDEFPLEGGAVAVVMDRKAAAFVFKRRLHTISVFEVRAEGLPFAEGDEPIGRVRARRSTQRGFSVLEWKDGELGYLMVSDASPDELHALAVRLVGP